jgi:hypothetical protein
MALFGRTGHCGHRAPRFNGPHVVDLVSRSACLPDFRCNSRASPRGSYHLDTSDRIGLIRRYRISVRLRQQRNRTDSTCGRLYWPYDLGHCPLSLRKDRLARICNFARFWICLLQPFCSLQYSCNTQKGCLSNTVELCRAYRV